MCCTDRNKSNVAVATRSTAQKVVDRMMNTCSSGSFRRRAPTASNSFIRRRAPTDSDSFHRKAPTATGSFHRKAPTASGSFFRRRPRFVKKAISKIEEQLARSGKKHDREEGRNRAQGPRAYGKRSVLEGQVEVGKPERSIQDQEHCMDQEDRDSRNQDLERCSPNSDAVEIENTVNVEHEVDNLVCETQVTEEHEKDSSTLESEESEMQCQGDFEQQVPTEQSVSADSDEKNEGSGEKSDSAEAYVATKANDSDEDVTIPDGECAVGDIIDQGVQDGKEDFQEHDGLEQRSVSDDGCSESGTSPTLVINLGSGYSSRDIQSDVASVSAADEVDQELLDSTETPTAEVPPAASQANIQEKENPDEMPEEIDGDIKEMFNSVAQTLDSFLETLAVVNEPVIADEDVQNLIADATKEVQQFALDITTEDIEWFGILDTRHSNVVSAPSYAGSDDYLMEETTIELNDTLDTKDTSYSKKSGLVRKIKSKLRSKRSKGPDHSKSSQSPKSERKKKKKKKTSGDEKSRKSESRKSEKKAAPSRREVFRKLSSDSKDLFVTALKATSASGEKVLRKLRKTTERKKPARRSTKSSRKSGDKPSSSRKEIVECSQRKKDLKKSMKQTEKDFQDFQDLIADLEMPDQDSELEWVGIVGSSHVVRSHHESSDRSFKLETTDEDVVDSNNLELDMRSSHVQTACNDLRATIACTNKFESELQELQAELDDFEEFDPMDDGFSFKDTILAQPKRRPSVDDFMEKPSRRPSLKDLLMDKPIRRPSLKDFFMPGKNGSSEFSLASANDSVHKGPEKPPKKDKSNRFNLFGNFREQSNRIRRQFSGGLIFRSRELDLGDLPNPTPELLNEDETSSGHSDLEEGSNHMIHDS